MPKEKTHVEDAEELIRRIPADVDCEYDPESGQLVGVASVAFADRHMQPSVDRRAMLQTLEAAKKDPSDGLLKLIAYEVRAIRTAQVVNGKVNATDVHTTDVVHSPIESDNPDGVPENSAHAHIEITPPMSKAKFDSKVRERLARLAVKYGWVIPPTRGR